VTGSTPNLAVAKMAVLDSTAFALVVVMILCAVVVIWLLTR